MKIQKAITYAALTAICLLLVIPIIVYTFPFILGADGSYTVMSGSMSPALTPGDLVIIKGDPIDVGDMVTVESGEFTYTHRVVERLEDGRFRLKGDANEEPDPGLVEASQIIGKVVLVFPFGHLYTSYGFAVALLAPAALIIGKQVYNVYQHTKSRNRRETMMWRRNSHSALDTTTLLLVLILTVSTTRVIAPHFIAGSSSYFSDTGWSTAFFRTGIWHVDASVDIKPDTLNLESKGGGVTVYTIIETEYDEDDIVVDSVMLGGEIEAERCDVREDGRLMFKFDRVSLIEYLVEEGYGDGDEVTLIVSGEFSDGVKFSGEDTIFLRQKGEAVEG